MIDEQDPVTVSTGNAGIAASLADDSLFPGDGQIPGGRNSSPDRPDLPTVTRIIYGFIDLAAADLGLTIDPRDYPEVEIENTEDGTSAYLIDRNKIVMHISQMDNGGIYGEEVMHWLRDHYPKKPNIKWNAARWLSDPDYRKELKLFLDIHWSHSGLAMKLAVEEFFGRVGEDYFREITQDTEFEGLFKDRAGRNWSDPERMEAGLRALRNAVGFAMNFDEKYNEYQQKSLEAINWMTSEMRVLSEDWQQGRMDAKELCRRILEKTQQIPGILREVPEAPNLGTWDDHEHIAVRCARIWKMLHSAAVKYNEDMDDPIDESENPESDFIESFVDMAAGIEASKKDFESSLDISICSPVLSALTDIGMRYRVSVKASNTSWHYAGYLCAERFMRENDSWRARFSDLLSSPDESVFMEVFVLSGFEKFLEANGCGEWWKKVILRNSLLRRFSNLERYILSPFAE